MSKIIENDKKALVPKLRFPEFRDAGEWGQDVVKNVVTTLTPPKKLPSALYKSEGEFPIVDQSQKYICGWTDDKQALVCDGLPLIIFGDHTCALKIVNQPFAQGADGIKILKAKKRIYPEFLYHQLLYNPVKMDSYKRHFSTLKEKVVLFPEVETEEQQKIADCLSSLDTLIAAQSKKIDALKTHKKGLMQQLFPREGETVPRLRFPEFRDAGEWEEKLLCEIGQIITGKTPSTKNKTLWGSGVLFITPTDIPEDHKYQRSAARKVVKTRNVKTLPKGSIVYTCIASIGKMALTTCESTTNQQINSIVVHSETNNEFVYYSLANLTPWIKTIPASSTLAIINKTEFSSILIKLPNELEEQQKIADCLSSLDALITGQAEKLDALKTHKKGLMQQLFPDLEGKE